MENESKPDDISAKEMDSYLLRALMQNTPDCVYFKDLDSRFIRISQAMSTWFGLPSQEAALGKTDFDMFSDEHASQARADEVQIIQTGRPMVNKEEKETWPDGHETWVSTSKVPLRDEEGDIIGTFGLSRDVTEKKLQQQQIAEYAQKLEQANQQMEADLAMASEMQMAFLPQAYPTFPPDVPASQSALRFLHYYRPSGEVGGDYFSVVPINNRQAGILICDVMGHGVRAGLVTAMVAALQGDLVQTTETPGEFMTELHRRLWDILKRFPDMIFTTALCGVLDATTGVFRYASAAHPVPMVYRAGSGTCSYHDSSTAGPALALYEGNQYETAELTLGEGDRLVLYTDGLFEARSPSGEEFGPERLLRSLQAQMKQPLEELFTPVIEEIDVFAGGAGLGDDACALCIELARFAPH